MSTAINLKDKSYSKYLILYNTGKKKVFKIKLQSNY